MPSRWRLRASVPASPCQPVSITDGHQGPDQSAAPSTGRAGFGCRPHTIAWHLDQQHQLRVSPATIWRTLKRAGLIVPEPKKKPKAAYISFAAEQPNEMWQTDFTHNRLTRPDGTPGGDVEILCFIDDHSRYVLSVTCHQPVTGPTVVDAFRQAVADQGIPSSVLSDIQAWCCPEGPWIVRPAV